MSLTGDLMRAGFPRREALALTTALGNGGGGGGGGGAVAFARTGASYEIASLDTGATQSGTVELGLGYRLYALVTYGQTRVRLYATQADADADVDRPVETTPVGVRGLVLDYVTDAAGMHELSPLVDGANLEFPIPSTSIPIIVTNLGATGASGVGFIYLPTE